MIQGQATGTCNARVGGSIPLGSTKFKALLTEGFFNRYKMNEELKKAMDIIADRSLGEYGSFDNELMDAGRLLHKTIEDLSMFITRLVNAGSNARNQASEYLVAKGLQGGVLKENTND